MMSRDRKFVRVAWKWQHTVSILLAIFCSLHEVSSSKTNLENAFFVKFMYVTICDLHGHRRSQVMVRNERLYMSSYLWIIVTIALSGTLLKIFPVEILNFSKMNVL